MLSYTVIFFESKSTYLSLKYVIFLFNNREKSPCTPLPYTGFKMRPRITIRGSVGPLVRPSVHRFVRWLRVFFSGFATPETDRKALGGAGWWGKGKAKGLKRTVRGGGGWGGAKRETHLVWLPNWFPSRFLRTVFQWRHRRFVLRRGWVGFCWALEEKLTSITRTRMPAISRYALWVYGSLQVKSP